MQSTKMKTLLVVWSELFRKSRIIFSIITPLDPCQP